jgi:hypothetical protein
MTQLGNYVENKHDAGILPEPPDHCGAACNWQFLSSEKIVEPGKEGEENHLGHSYRADRETVLYGQFRKRKR